jgi:transcriptional regulator with XRE-family HTH domain
MNWALIRNHYEQLLADARRAGVTQKSVAEAGALSGQNAISKLLANNNLGPSVETFVKAVRGLGKDLSVFFEEIERGVAPQPAETDAGRSHRRIRTRAGIYEHTTVRRDASRASTIREGPHAATSIALPEFTTDGSESERLELLAFVKAQFEDIERRLDRVTRYMEHGGSANGGADRTKPAQRQDHRRRTEKSA